MDEIIVEFPIPLTEREKKLIYGYKGEIVRCKDCVSRDICRTTNIWAVAPRDDWFCADGERRDDGD